MKLSKSTIVIFDTPDGWPLPTRYPVGETVKFAASTAVLTGALYYGYKRYKKFCEYFGEEEEEED